MKSKIKNGLAGLIFGVGSLVNVAKGGILEIKNNTSQPGISRQAVVADDGSSDGYWLESPLPCLYSYFKNSQGNKLKIKGINPDIYESHKIYLGSLGVTSLPDHFLRLRFLDSSGYEKRNIVLRQDQTNPNADPTFYDVKKLIQDGSGYGYITLTTLDPIEWDIISTNYADINLDGKVDMKDYALLSKNWLGSPEQNTLDSFADINRDGKVDTLDLAILSENFLWNGHNK